jgi:hypothetical protein
VHPFEKTLDDLFGMKNFYKKQHVIFEQSTMRINESFTPPVGENSWAEWKYHMGGIEGIHQKNGL